MELSSISALIFSFYVGGLKLKFKPLLSTSVSVDSSCNTENAREAYCKGIKFLALGKPAKAISLLEKALKLNFEMEEAKSALSEAKSGLSWSSPKFCSKCQKLLEPTSEYPILQYEGFCPRCGQAQSFNKEVLINMMELFTKLIFFGVYILALLFFVAMPNTQLLPSGLVWVAWNPLAEGVFLSASFTPIFITFFLLTNDPWGNYSLRLINFTFFEPLLNNHPLYLAASILLLITSVYLFFFLMLTPFLTVHRKGMWMEAKHQKRLLICTFIVCGFIIAMRMVNSVFY